MLTALASGVLLGLAAGLAPGPLLALVLAQTLRHGPREGCKIAFAPLVTDAPIIFVTLILAAEVAQMRSLLGIIFLAGGAFVLYLAWETHRPAHQEIAFEAEGSRSWRKGIVTNLLSPHPWLFWLTVGAATLGQALAQSWVVAVAFLFGFYLCLVGSKVLVALLAGRSRGLLDGRLYRIVMHVLAVSLVAFGLLLFREGARHLAIL